MYPFIFDAPNGSHMSDETGYKVSYLSACVTGRQGGFGS